MKIITYFCTLFFISLFSLFSNSLHSTPYPIVNEINEWCDTIHVFPFTEDFNSFGQNHSSAFPNCWYRPQTYLYSGITYPAIIQYDWLNPNPCLAFQSSVFIPTFFVSPALNRDIHQLMVSFQLMVDDPYFSGSIQVGVMSNPYDANSFELVQTISLDDYEWETFDVYFSSTQLTGNNHYIAFKHQSNDDYYYYWLDNVTISAVSNCARPMNPFLSQNSSSSATIQWHPVGNETSWQIKYGIAYSSTSDTMWIVHDSTAILTNLLPSTNYVFNVRSICGSSDTSEWSNPLYFSTLCEEISLFPYSESFDDVPSIPSSIPPCWYRVADFSQYSLFYPSIIDAQSSSPPSSLFFMSNPSNPTIISLPAVDYDLANLFLSFSMKSVDTLFQMLEIGVMSNLNFPDSFIPVDTIIASQFLWYSYVVPFCNMSLGNENRYIAFRHSSQDVNSFLFIDDVMVDIIPPCLVPQLLAGTVVSNAIQLTWSPQDNALSYYLYRDGVLLAADILDTTYTDNNLQYNTLYHYYVTTNCINGESESSDTVSFTTDYAPCLAPQLLAGAVVSNTIQLTWSPQDNALSYYLYRDGVLLAADIFDTTYTDNNLQYNTLYHYYVTTNCINGESESSDTVSFTTDYAPCLAPQLLAGAVVSNAIQLTWSPQDNALSYYLYRDDVLLAADILDTTYTDNNLQYNTLYHYYVTTNCINGESESSDTVSFTTDYAPCLAPQLLAGTVVSNAIQLTWNPQDNALSYYLYRDGVLLAADILDTTYTDNNLQYNTLYHYYVTTYCINGESESSDTVSFTTDYAPCLAPQLLTGAVVSNAIQLTWSPQDNALSYYLYRDGVLISADILDTTYIDNNLQYNTLYHYYVTTNCINGESEPSDTVSFTTDYAPCLAPQLLAGAVVSNTIQLTWSPQDNALSYYLYRDGVLLAADIFDTTYTDNNLQYNTLYHYYVTTNCINGESESSDTVSFITDYAPCLAPQLLAGAVVSNTIQLTWSPQDNALSYYLYRDGVLLAADIFDTTYTDNNLQYNTLYHYYVTTNCINGESESSDTVSFITDYAPCLAPQLLAGAVVSNTIQLTWSPQDNALSYYLYRDGVLLAADILDTTYIDNNLQYNTLYHYYVTAYCINGESEPSDTVSFTTDYAPCLAPQLLAGAVVSNAIQLTWSPQDNALSYYLYRDGVLISADILDTTYTDNNLQYNTLYHYYVTTNCINGESEPSDTVSFITDYAPCLAPQLLAGAVVSNAIQLTWSPQDNTLSYYLYRDGVLLAADILDTTYTDNNLQYNTLYHYYVTAYCINGESESSDTVSFTTDYAPCLAPQLLTGAVVSNAIQLTWSPQDNALSYYLYRDGVLLAADILDTTYTDNNLQYNTLYHYYVTTYCINGESEPSDTVSFTISEIEESQISSYISIYPNPVQSLLTIISSTTMEEVKFYDLSGKLVMFKMVKDDSYEIDMQRFVNGVYFLEIINNELERTIYKVVKR